MNKAGGSLLMLPTLPVIKAPRLHDLLKEQTRLEREIQLLTDQKVLLERQITKAYQAQRAFEALQFTTHNY